MRSDFEPFSHEVDHRVIPDGHWQRVGGFLIDALGIFAAMAAASGPAPDAAATAAFCLPVGSGLLFWGFMLRYFSALEEKLGLIIVGLDVGSGTPER